MDITIKTCAVTFSSQPLQPHTNIVYKKMCYIDAVKQVKNLFMSICLVLESLDSIYFQIRKNAKKSALFELFG